MTDPIYKEYFKMCDKEQKKILKRRLEEAKKWGHDQYDGVYYDYDLCYDGMRAYMFKEDHHSKEDIEKAKRQLRREHDVVHLRVVEI